VDLDGAKAGERRQTGVIRRIRRSLGREVRLEVGGGLRSREAVDETLAAGADRVVLGTAAIHDRGLIERLVERIGESRLAIALDVRDGIAVGQGWVPGATGRSMEEAVETLTGAGVRTFIVTEIDRDGLLGGPDIGLLERVTELTDADVIASGGIATLEDLEATRRIGCRGAVVGRAFYDGRIDLREAIAATR
jgi:phosphoribosylformimino-5-aminoimidazole carboxamide ribotide isomerase